MSKINYSFKPLARLNLKWNKVIVLIESKLILTHKCTEVHKKNCLNKHLLTGADTFYKSSQVNHRRSHKRTKGGVHSLCLPRTESALKYLWQIRRVLEAEASKSLHCASKNNSFVIFSCRLVQTNTKVVMTRTRWLFK